MGGLVENFKLTRGGGCSEINKMVWGGLYQNGGGGMTMSLDKGGL